MCGATNQPAGNSYFPVTENAHQSTLAGWNTDDYVMILDVTSPTDVQVDYLSYYGGGSTEGCYAIVIDDEGYVYIAGDTWSDDIIGSVFPCKYHDALIAVFHPNGSLITNTCFGGSADDVILELQVLQLPDQSVLLYFAGTTKSENIPLLSPFVTTNPGFWSSMLAVITFTSERTFDTMLFSTYMSETDVSDVETDVSSLVVLPNGRIMLAGSSRSPLPGSSHNPTMNRDAYYMIVDCPAFVPLPTPSPSATPSTSPSDTPSQSTSPKPGDSTAKHSDQSGAIIGGSIAGAVAILASVLVLVFYRKKSKKNTKHQDVELQPESHYDESALAMNRQSVQEEDIAKAMLDKKWNIPYEDIKIRGEIGRGAFGVVYKGRWRNCDCVVKQLNIDRADEKSVQSFLKEAETTKQLRNHQNVCIIFGVCTSPEHPICIVMEFVAGGNLLKHIFEKSITLNKDTIVKMGSDITSGMSHLHHENILHCDLACRNLLVERKGQDDYLIKITDFGLAHSLSNQATGIYDASSSTAVPIRWSAPEVLTKMQMSKASDIWSFGVVMWEILEGKNPYFQMYSNSEVVNYVCEQKKVLPKPQEAEFPSEIYDVMVRCWSFDPTDRPTFDELYQFFDGLSTAKSRRVTVEDAYTLTDIPDNHSDGHIEVYREKSSAPYGNRSV